MKRRIQTLLLSASAAFFMMLLGEPSISEAQTTQASRENLLRILSGYEYIPSAQDLAALGSGVPNLLMQIVHDQDAMKHHRLRALGVLRHYLDRSDVHSFLTRLLTETNLPSGFLRVTIVTLGQTAKGGAISTLTPFLSSKDVDIREATAKALYATGDPATAGLLRKAAVSEPEPFLKDSMKKMSQELQAGTPKKDDGVSSEQR